MSFFLVFNENKMTQILHQNFSDQAIVMSKWPAFTPHKIQIKNYLPPIILLLIFHNHFSPNQSPEKATHYPPIMR